jgi:hypothetical protein
VFDPNFKYYFISSFISPSAICMHWLSYAFSQDSQMLNFDDIEIQVFNQLQAKHQDILKAMKGGKG